MNNNERRLNDRMVKTIGIPALGLAIPNLSGLITNNLYTWTQLLACYAFFILIAFIVWQGNIFLMNFIRRKFEWSFDSYYKVIISLFLANIVYSGLLSAIALDSWKAFSHEKYTSNGPLVNTVLLIIIAACFITNIYEIL